jgi:toxin ParE1/3/4
MPLRDRPWRLSNKTVADLEEIWRHTQRQWSTAQADDYHSDIMDMIGDLAADRKRGRQIQVSDRSYLYRPCGSHNIFFRDEKTRIVIIRILHNRMDPARHL